MTRARSAPIADAESAAARLRRQRGVYYTPAPVAKYIVRRCLEAFPAELDDADGEPLRILDPACGEGVFLWEAYEFLKHRLQRLRGRELIPAERLRIVREHLFGVDLDRAALTALRARLAMDIGGRGAEVNAVCDANLRCGDALRGPDFAEAVATADNDGLDWGQSFPAAAARGGFDIVLGNPPYRRECHARAEFERLATLPLGRRWRQARMDLWYYFFHRGLDLLRPEGLLSFIVPSYWTASAGARKLIERLADETTLQEFVLLEAAPVFPEVVGRHLIFRTQRNGAGGGPAAPCQVFSLPPGHAGDVAREEFWERLGDARAAGPCETLTIPQRQLVQQGRLVLTRSGPAPARFREGRMLGECYDVRQGMAENPPVINARLNRLFANRYRVGEGVFVLSAVELQALEFEAVERRHLRPYFEASRLGRYYVPAATDRQILYLTRATAPTLADCPRVAAHLERFRPVLERRRETRLGLCAWWHLHWPREERLFVEPRVLSIQMGRVPQFAWSAQPTFVGFSVNLIVNKLRAAEAAPFSLESLTGILNSTVAAEWFARLAKRRGVSLEISGGLLRQFPLPPADAALDAELASLVRQRQELARRLPDRDAALPAEAQQLETAIERIVARLYA